MHGVKTGLIMTASCVLFATVVIFSARELEIYNASHDAPDASRYEFASIARECITDYYLGSPAPAKHWQSIGDFLNRTSQSENSRVTMLRMALLTCDTSGGANSLIFSSLAFKDRKALSKDLKMQVQLGRISSLEKLNRAKLWINELDRMEQPP